MDRRPGCRRRPGALRAHRREPCRLGVESTATGERVVIYIWDNGAGGDWFDGVAWSDPSPSCPDPPAEPGPNAYTDGASGDVTIIDADSTSTRVWRGPVAGTPCAWPTTRSSPNPATSGRDRVEGRGTGISKWSLAALGVAILLVIILAQNTESVDVDVLWTSFEAPLFLVVLIAALGLTVIWELVTLVLRHRRRNRR